MAGASSTRSTTSRACTWGCEPGTQAARPTRSPTPSTTLRSVALVTVAALGDTLRSAGLTARALGAWSGTDRVSALPARIGALAAAPLVPAATALALFVAGAELAIDRIRGLPIDELIAVGLVKRAGSRVRATVAIVPCAQALIVCDRADAPREPELVCWPDDSSHHLASALPAGRVHSWLDLGCGSAVAQLARPKLAGHRVAIDRNSRAVRYAQLGAELSGIALSTLIGDLGDDHGVFDLVSCNAPIPGSSDVTWWRRADPGLLGRLFEALPSRIVPGGLVVIHAALDAIPANLRGQRVIVAYTPADRRAFAILWWRPDAPARQITARRVATPERPHLDPRDHDDALAFALPSLC